VKRCPITYEPIGRGRYSARGLRRLSPRLSTLADFPYSAERQRQEAALRAAKMSIQGMQPKLSVRLDVRAGRFEIVDRGGRYVVKPQNPPYPELPENEDLTMRLAAAVGIETPLHGLVRCADGSLSYFVKRFDRAGRKDRLSLEDFAQLSGRERETKYDFSVERLVGLLDYCTFPMVARAELLTRLLFSFVVGNEDMHLKNHSLITRSGRVELAPAYDYLSTTIAYESMGRDRSDIEESALPLRGRKKKLSGTLWTHYFARERLGLRPAVIEEVLRRLVGAQSSWDRVIAASFLSPPARERYSGLIRERLERLQ
jgi:serine/threonine-protein kinase HipA